MSEIKHTPGPWEWVGRDLESNFPGHYEAVIETSVSCGQFCYGGSVDMKIGDADKQLIAAAPELLKTVRIQHDIIDRLLVLVIELDKEFRPTKSAIWPLIIEADSVGVIAKAEGKS